MKKKTIYEIELLEDFVHKNTQVDKFSKINELQKIEK